MNKLMTIFATLILALGLSGLAMAQDAPEDGAISYEVEITSVEFTETELAVGEGRQVGNDKNKGKGKGVTNGWTATARDSVAVTADVTMFTYDAATDTFVEGETLVGTTNYSVDDASTFVVQCVNPGGEVVFPAGPKHCDVDVPEMDRLEIDEDQLEQDLIANAFPTA